MFVQGPVFPSPLKAPEDVKTLKSPAEALPELQYVFDAITTTRKELNGIVPLLGFTGAPVRDLTLFISCDTTKEKTSDCEGSKFLIFLPHSALAF